MLRAGKIDRLLARLDIESGMTIGLARLSSINPVVTLGKGAHLRELFSVKESGESSLIKVRPSAEAARLGATTATSGKGMGELSRIVCKSSLAGSSGDALNPMGWATPPDGALICIGPSVRVRQSHPVE